MELSRSYHSSLRARAQTDGLESRSANSNFPQEDLWLGITFGLPVIRAQCDHETPGYSNWQ
jgi:hypothetical protein